MSEITFSKQQKAMLVSKMTSYFELELNQEIGQFDCEFLLDFISKEIGSHYYNKGLADAQAMIASKMEDLIFAIEDIEQPTEL